MATFNVIISKNRTPVWITIDKNRLLCINICNKSSNNNNNSSEFVLYLTHITGRQEKQCYRFQLLFSITCTA